MQSELERVLGFQPRWSSDKTREMDARGKLVRDEIPRSLKVRLAEFLRTMPDDMKDFAVEGSDGIGRKSETPWVRIYSRARSPRATGGWYLVYLFDAFGDGLYLSINQGTTKWTNGETKKRPWAQLDERVNWARSAIEKFVSPNIGLLEDIDLPTRKSPLAAGYERGNVFSIRYDGGAVPDDARLLDDFTYMCQLLSHLYSAADSTAFVPGDSTPELDDAVLLGEIAAGTRRLQRGYRLTHEERVAIETRAVQLVIEYLRTLGYATRDVGSTRSYDIHAKRGDEDLYVEVKGTVSKGTDVVLTRNEVALHTANFPATMLAVVSSIRLDRSGAKVIARQGSLSIYHPWMPVAENLQPLTFAYSIPPEPSERIVSPPDHSSADAVR